MVSPKMSLISCTLRLLNVAFMCSIVPLEDPTADQFKFSWEILNIGYFLCIIS